jgi:hypothetical protein
MLFDRPRVQTIAMKPDMFDDSSTVVPQITNTNFAMTLSSTTQRMGKVDDGNFEDSRNC